MPNDPHVFHDRQSVLDWTIKDALHHVRSYIFHNEPDLMPEFEHIYWRFAHPSDEDNIRIQLIAHQVMEAYTAVILPDLHEFSQRFYQALREADLNRRPLPELSNQVSPAINKDLLNTPLYRMTLDDIIEINDMNDDPDADAVRRYLADVPASHLPELRRRVAAAVENYRPILADISRSAAQDAYRSIARMAQSANSSP